MSRPTLGINPRTVMVVAAALVSEQAENPEYDRGVTELAADLLGIPSEDRPELLMELQLRQRRTRREAR